MSAEKSHPPEEQSRILEVIREAARAIEHASRKGALPLDKTLWTREQVADFLQLSQDQLREVLCKPGFPRMRLIGMGRWLAGEVFDWRVARTDEQVRALTVSPIGPNLPEATPLDRVPSELANIPGLYEIPLKTGPGIYFLCLGAKVVYVGQSVEVISRIADHCRNRAESFDRVLFLPCPEESLGETERRFIRDLRPPLNVRVYNDYRR